MSFRSVRSPTLFIDNLPFQIRKVWLYNLFSKFGKIRDIFIPNKRSKITNQSFGFVRFSHTSDAALAITKTHNSWCWGFNLTVKFARFLKTQDNQSNSQIIKEGSYQRSFREGDWKVNNHQWKPSGGLWKGEVFSGNGFSRIVEPSRNAKQNERFRGNINPVPDNTTQSLRGAVRGKEIWRMKGIPESSKQGEERNKGLASQSKEKRQVVESINLQSSGNGCLLRSAVGKIKRLISTQKLTELFKKEKDVCVKIKSIGGRYVLITFPDVEVRNEVIKESWVEYWFDEIKEWKGDSAQLERFVWLGCYGMPLDVWCVPTFRSIGSRWGQFMQVDEITLKEISYVKGRILIATKCIGRIEGTIELKVNGEKYLVNVIEEESYRSVTPLLLSSVSGILIEEEDVDVETKNKEKEANVDGKAHSVVDLATHKENKSDMDDKEDLKSNQKETGLNNSVQQTDDVGSRYGSQQGDSCSEEAAISKIGTGVPPIINGEAMVMDSMYSSLGIEKSVVGSEMVVDSFGQLSVVNQSHSNKPIGLLNQESELMMKGTTHVELEKEIFHDKDGTTVEVFQEDHACNSTNEENLDHFDANQISIQATIKGIKGKRNRKSIDEILGYTKVNPRDTKGKRNKKSVVLRSAVASAALSASISSGAIKNRNKILLDEAQAIWAVDKLFGISYEGDEVEVISRIAEMEALNKTRIDDHL